MSLPLGPTGPHKDPAYRGLFRVKGLDDLMAEAERPSVHLRRVLGPVQLTLLGIGAIVGAGIFATIGTAAAGDIFRPGAGPALPVSFILTAVVCTFTALCYAEFASLVPISGSAYTYSYATLGEIVAWIIGWDLIIEYSVGNIAVAISWANYCKTLLAGFGLHVPDWLSMDYRTAARIVDSHGVHTVFQEAPRILGVPIVFNLLAVFIVAAVSCLLIWGIQASTRFNAVMVSIKIVVLFFFVIVGLYWVKPANWHPFIPNGWAGISAGAAIVFFAYIGFDAVSTVSEETVNPSRNIPLGIMGSLGACTLLYVIVSIVFTGLISYPELRARLATEQAEPLTLALAHATHSTGWEVGIVALGSVIAHTAVMLVFQLGQPRIFFSMSRDGLLPPLFHRVHPRFRTPHISTMLTGLFVAIFSAVASIDEMVDLTNIGTLFAFILVCAGTIVLRKRDPNRPRPFRVPSGGLWAGSLYALFALIVLLVPLPRVEQAVLLVVGAAVAWFARNHIFPVLGILSCLYLIYYLPPMSWLRFAAWLNVGFAIYAGYGSVRSHLTGREGAPDPDAHNARTARAGIWLALSGGTLLFLARALDIWLEVGRVAGRAARLSDLVCLADLHLWLDVSWFLVVPLAINGLVLCPVILRRLKRIPGSATPEPSPALTKALTLAQAAFVVLYLGAVYLHSH